MSSKKWFLLFSLYLSPQLCTADQIDVSIEKRSHGEHFIEGHFMVEASTGIVWETLTDYEDLPSFVSSVRSSNRVEQKEGLLVKQVMSGKAGVFSKKIELRLDILETVPAKIEFRDIGKKNFSSYYGSWEISKWDNGVGITYKLFATPDFFAPDFIANGAFKRNVKLLLTEVREEIIKRNESTEKGQ